MFVVILANELIIYNFLFFLFFSVSGKTKNTTKLIA